MKAYIEERVQQIADYVLESGATVRQAAKLFGTSKSTVHKDLTERLCAISTATARAVAEVLKRNKEERHIRGGNATRLKYKSI
jgi:putative DeoR family transcriptional regulator (stage III sporulation protein D)